MAQAPCNCLAMSRTWHLKLGAFRRRLQPDNDSTYLSGVDDLHSLRTSIVTQQKINSKRRPTMHNNINLLARLRYYGLEGDVRCQEKREGLGRILCDWQNTLYELTKAGRTPCPADAFALLRDIACIKMLLRRVNDQWCWVADTSIHVYIPQLKLLIDKKMQ